MKLGLQLPVFGSDGDGTRSFAVAAEQLGFDSVWTGDHFVIPAEIRSPYPYVWRFTPGQELFPNRNFLEAISLCSFVAGATTSLQIGIGVLILPMRNTLALAKELATLDVLVGGSSDRRHRCGLADRRARRPRSAPRPSWPTDRRGRGGAADAVE